MTRDLTSSPATILAVVGARPNFMKVAPIVAELKKFPELFNPFIVHTGQHYDDKLSKVFFDDLEKPVMEAKDTTFGAGHIGFGSFDDTGKVKNIRIWTPTDAKPGTSRTGFYQRP